VKSEELLVIVILAPVSIMKLIALIVNNVGADEEER
jgi:hypothetical protein